MEEYVTFETAKLAKEKGFNEYCRKIFNTEGKSSNLTGYMQMKKWNINDKVHLYDTDSEEFEEPDIECTQPTQSFLQKWLRENHFVHISIVLKQKIWSYTLYDYKNNMYLTTRINGFSTYESALEDGLFISLQMI